MGKSWGQKIYAGVKKSPRIKKYMLGDKKKAPGIKAQPGTNK